MLEELHVTLIVAYMRLYYQYSLLYLKERNRVRRILSSNSFTSHQKVHLCSEIITEFIFSWGSNGSSFFFYSSPHLRCRLFNSSRFRVLSQVPLGKLWKAQWAAPTYNLPVATVKHLNRCGKKKERIIQATQLPF